MRGSARSCTTAEPSHALLIRNKGLAASRSLIKRALPTLAGSNPPFGVKVHSRPSPRQQANRAALAGALSIEECEMNMRDTLIPRGHLTGVGNHVIGSSGAATNTARREASNLPPGTNAEIAPAPSMRPLPVVVGRQAFTSTHSRAEHTRRHHRRHNHNRGHPHSSHDSHGRPHGSHDSSPHG